MDTLHRQILEVTPDLAFYASLSETLLLAKLHSDRPLIAAEVYVPRGGQDNTDVTKRGGRYTSDFVWNTKWQDVV